MDVYRDLTIVFVIVLSDGWFGVSRLVLCCLKLEMYDLNFRIAFRPGLVWKLYL